MYNGNGFDLFGTCFGGLCMLAILILGLVAMRMVMPAFRRRALMQAL